MCVYICGGKLSGGIYHPLVSWSLKRKSGVYFDRLLQKC